MPSCDPVKTSEIRKEEIDTFDFLGDSIVPKLPAAYAYHLYKVDIAIKFDLDWKIEAARRPDKAGIAMRKTDINRTMRRAAAMLNINRRGRYGVGYYFKLEVSPAGVGHAHGVIARKGIGSVDAFIKVLNYLWQDIGEHPKIELYDNAYGTRGIDYACKGAYVNGVEQFQDDFVSPAMLRLMRETQTEVRTEDFLREDFSEDKNLADYF